MFAEACYFCVINAGHLWKTAVQVIPANTLCIDVSAYFQQPIQSLTQDVEDYYKDPDRADLSDAYVLLCDVRCSSGETAPPREGV